jgi:hypothetical protein
MFVPLGASINSPGPLELSARKQLVITFTTAKKKNNGRDLVTQN